MKDLRPFVAWSLGGAAVLLAVVTGWLISLNHLAHLQDAVYPLGFVVFAVIGAFIAANRPGNLVGWLFCLAGLTNLFDNAAQQYAVYALRTHPGAPDGRFMFWLGMGWIASVGWGTMALFLPLLFPTGHLLSARWRILAVLGSVMLVLQVVFQAFTQGSDTVAYVPWMRNPYVIPPLQAALPVVAPIDQASLVPLMAGCIASLILRYRRAGQEERLQIKWFAFAAILLALMIAASALNSATVNSAAINYFGDYLFFVGISVLPLSAAVAIMRYRLFDIDLVINRTLVYGSLTLSLAAIYIGGVVGLQAVFRTVTGQSSDLAIAIVTLAVAALFNPWRRRLQGFIDRRFYRRKYDASRTLASFSVRLRDEVDLDHLSGDIAKVVYETVQPAQVMLWLRDTLPTAEARGVE
jgi:hypothetical protein